MTVTERVWVHGSGCPAEGSGLRSVCTCNLKKPEYDDAWVIRGVETAKAHAIIDARFKELNLSATL